MAQELYLGRKVDWDDTSNAAIYLDLEDAAAQGIRIQEYVSGQTAPSIEIENNAGTTVFQVLASATTANAFVHTVATTTGNGVIVTADDLTTGSGLSVNSSATAITGAGRMLEVFHTGASSTSGTLVEFSSAAADETIIFAVTASAALAAGKAVHINTNSMTTGTALDIDLAALTTGIGIDISSCPVVKMGINFTDGTASTIDPSATAETGWINVGVAGTVRYIPYYAAS
jgi:hypothetical protein